MDKALHLIKTVRQGFTMTEPNDARLLTILLTHNRQAVAQADRLRGRLGLAGGGDLLAAVLAADPFAVGDSERMEIAETLGERPLDDATLPPITDPGRPFDTSAGKLIRSDRLAGLSAIERGFLLLRNDEDEAAHSLVQQHEGAADADLVHAIMHRRERDFGNARYWARIVDGHPVYDRFADRVAIAEAVIDTHRQDGRWSPAAFVAACEAVRPRERSDAAVSARTIAELEARAVAEHLGLIERTESN